MGLRIYIYVRSILIYLILYKKYEDDTYKFA